MNKDQQVFQRQELFLLCVLISVAVLIRLIKISQPFIDHWSWRQCDVAMIAENFYLNGFNIFYPEMSYTGNLPGYVGTEFPLLPFIASLFYLVFGIQEWVGRSISVMFFAVSIPFFYLLVKKASNERSAILAAVTYSLIPLSIFAARSFITDMAMLSFSIIALYCFAEWLDRPTDMRWFIAAGVGTSLAILVKLPAVIIGLPLLYLALQSYGLRMVREPKIWLFGSISLGFPIAWYFHTYLVSLNPPYILFWEPSSLARFVNLDVYAAIARQTFDSSLTPLVSATMLIGLFVPSQMKFGRVFHWWLVAMVLFVIFAGRGNRHQWYQLPVVPIAAACTGMAIDYVLQKLNKFIGTKVALIAATSIVFVGLAYLSYIYVKPLYASWQAPAWRAGREVNLVAPKNAIVVVATNKCDPTGIYYTRRKGWHFMEKDGWCSGTPSNSREAVDNLEKLRRQGGTHLVFDKYTMWWLDEYKELGKHIESNYQRLRQTDQYIIFDLSGKLPR